MPPLSPRDYDGLLASLHDLYACRSATYFPREALRACTRLIRCEMAGYTEIEPRDGTWFTILDSQDAKQVFGPYLDAWHQHYADHPVLKYHEKEAQPSVRTISDFLPLDKWKRKPLYNEFYRPLGLAQQLVIPFPRKRGLIIGIALNRERRAFSRRDRLIATLLQEHLFQAHQNATFIEQCQSQLVQVDDACSRVGVALITIRDDTRVIHCSDAAAAIIRRFVDWPATNSPMLPPVIRDWVQQELALARRKTDSLRAPRQLTLAGDGSRLILRVVPHVDPSLYVIAAREMRQQFDWQVLCSLGLTLREAQVLFWITQGFTTAQIAQRLAISSRTVHKHIERIYGKLGVSTRLEAAILARESLLSL